MRTAIAPRLISMDEELIALRDVPGKLPRPEGGRKVSLVTVQRWIRHGLAGVAPLETLRIGRSVYTSREALRRFIDRVSEAKDGHRHGPAGLSSRAGQKADAELAEAGL